MMKHCLPRTISSSNDETTKAFLVALELSQTLKGRLARDVCNINNCYILIFGNIFFKNIVRNLMNILVACYTKERFLIIYLFK